MPHLSQNVLSLARCNHWKHKARDEFCKARTADEGQSIALCADQ